MIRRTLLLLLGVIVSLAVSAQQNAGNYQSGFKQEGNRFFFTNTNSKTIIEFCTPSMFRVRTSWSGNFEANEPWMVKQYNFQPVSVTTQKNAGYFSLTTSQLRVKVLQSPFRIEVYNVKGELLSTDNSLYKMPTPLVV